MHLVSSAADLPLSQRVTIIGLCTSTCMCHAAAVRAVWCLRMLTQRYRSACTRPTILCVQQTLKVITHAAFHPQDPNLLAFSTSRSVLSVADLRVKNVAADNAIEFGSANASVRIPSHMLRPSCTSCHRPRCGSASPLQLARPQAPVHAVRHISSVQARPYVPQTLQCACSAANATTQLEHSQQQQRHQYSTACHTQTQRSHESRLSVARCYCSRCRAPSSRSS